MAHPLLYLFSFAILLILPTYWFLGPAEIDAQPAPHLQPTLFTDLFVFYYLVIMFCRGLILSEHTGALPHHQPPPDALPGHQRSGSRPGIFPILTVWFALAMVHPLLFLGDCYVGQPGGRNVGGDYGLFRLLLWRCWPDRVVRNRLLKWLMRGPATASLTLALTTVVRRSGAFFRRAVLGPGARS